MSHMLLIDLEMLDNLVQLVLEILLQSLQLGVQELCRHVGVCGTVQDGSREQIRSTLVLEAH